MRIFLAGATGVIGRPLLPRLVQEGHQVTAITRRPEKVDALRAAGADAVVCDVFDTDRLSETVVGARPEVVIQHLTDLPQDLNPRNLKKAYARNDRVRGEGSANLVAAARAAGARRYIAQNVCFFYRAEGGWIKEEEAPVFEDAPEPFGSSVRLHVEMERRITAATEFEGLVLRYGFWYGPGTTYARDGFLAGEVRRRRFPIVGKGTGVSSFIHMDDVVDTTVLALEKGERGVYNVCDDDPAPFREWLPVYAQAVGAKRPLRVPAWVAAIFAGRYTAFMAVELRGASNQKFKRATGWEPRWPSWRQGFGEALR